MIKWVAASNPAEKPPVPTVPDLISASYVLVTPVRDEEATIGRTISSVINQTLQPQEWVVVSDGSTDGTDTLVRRASESHPWIRLLPLPPRPERSFAAVVLNTEKGIRSFRSSDFQFIGLLDADVTFQPDYFERLIGRFEDNPRLGLAGGVVIDVGQPRNRFPRNRQDVPGAVQFYRRACFESLGGLLPIPEGGWDGVACARARMSGFETRLFVDLVVDHLKPRNSAQGGAVRRCWDLGVRDFAVGCHPVFELVKCLSRVGEKPPVIGAIAWSLGYLVAAARRRQHTVPADLRAHVRAENLARLCETVGLKRRAQPHVAP